MGFVDPVRQKEYKRQYYLDHRESHLAACKRRRDADPEKTRREKADWYQRNRDATRAQHAEYRRANAEAIKVQKRAAYRKWMESTTLEERREVQARLAANNHVWASKPENKEKVAAYWRSPAGRAAQRRYRASGKWAMVKARRRGIACEVVDTLTPVEWQENVNRFQFRCAYCGIDLILGGMERDHIVPITRNGGHTQENVVPCCRSCNASKGDKEVVPPWFAPFSGIIVVSEARCA